MNKSQRKPMTSREFEEWNQKTDRQFARVVYATAIVFVVGFVAMIIWFTRP